MAAAGVARSRKGIPCSRCGDERPCPVERCIGPDGYHWPACAKGHHRNSKYCPGAFGAADAIKQRRIFQGQAEYLVSTTIVDSGRHGGAILHTKQRLHDERWIKETALRAAGLSEAIHAFLATLGRPAGSAAQPAAAAPPAPPVAVAPPPPPPPPPPPVHAAPPPPPLPQAPPPPPAVVVAPPFAVPQPAAPRRTALQTAADYNAAGARHRSIAQLLLQQAATHQRSAQGYFDAADAIQAGFDAALPAAMAAPPPPPARPAAAAAALPPPPALPLPLPAPRAAAAPVDFMAQVDGMLAAEDDADVAAMQPLPALPTPPLCASPPSSAGRRVPMLTSL